MDRSRREAFLMVLWSFRVHNIKHIHTHLIERSKLLRGPKYCISLWTYSKIGFLLIRYLLSQLI